MSIPLEIKSRLLGQGFANLAAWAVQQGYQPDTVHRTISRHCQGKLPARAPRGYLANQILTRLSWVIGLDLIPGALRDQNIQPEFLAGIEP